MFNSLNNKHPCDALAIATWISGEHLTPVSHEELLITLQSNGIGGSCMMEVILKLPFN